MKLANVRGYSLTYRIQIPLELKAIAMWRRRIDEGIKIYLCGIYITLYSM